MITVLVTKDVRYSSISNVHRFAALSQVPTSIRITTLVYHSSDEGLNSILEALSNLRYKNLIYISANPNTDISSFIIGLGGTVLAEEVYLEDEDLFTELIQSPGTDLVVSNSVNRGIQTVIETFMDKVHEGETEFSHAYLKLVADNAKKAIELSNKSRAEIEGTAKSTVNVFNIVSKNLKDQKLKTQNTLNALEELRSIHSNQNTSGAKSDLGSAIKASSSRVTTFSPVPYTGRTKLVCIKQVGTVPYLVSFVLGFKSFLATQRIKAGVIIILPVGDINEIRYGDYTGSSFITEKNVSNLRKLLQNDVVFTNYPTPKVVSGFLGTIKDFFIVLDLSLGSSPLVKVADSATKSTWYAVQSAELADAAKIPKKKIFSSINSVTGGKFTIPHIDNYSNRMQSQVASYQEHCSDAYKQMMI